MKTRLDQMLVNRGLAENRNKAQALILAGRVLVNGTKADKPGHSFPQDIRVQVTENLRFVSRSGTKLQQALDHFKIQVAGLMCMDVGASTGGFTDCLLQAGAARVCTVDVGHGQLDWKLRNDPRVEVREGVNARYMERGEFTQPFDLAVCDVSFISVTMIIPAIVPVLAKHGEMVILVKPQFEVEKEQVGRGGIIRDPLLHRAACERVAKVVLAHGFSASIIESSLLGAEGNQEFLLYAQR
jgi:23S rRNA (cytidine1920-2'-O)/16S rRNA (cytidine1409-2'-O)-methyltransferase